MDADKPTFNFNPGPPIRCKHCGKPRGEHKAWTFECPQGLRNRIGGYNWFGPATFEAREHTRTRFTPSWDRMPP